MLSRWKKQKPKQQILHSSDAVRLEQDEIQERRILLPAKDVLFKPNDSSLLNLTTLRQQHLRNIASYVSPEDTKNTKNFVVCPVKELMAIPMSYRPEAPKDSRYSTMNVACTLKDGRTYPTNMVIDPYYRAPVLGKYEDITPLIEEESSEELPRMLTTRSKEAMFTLREGLIKAGHVNQVSNDDMMTWRAEEEGRTILSMIEYGVLRTRIPNLQLLKVPVEDIEDKELTEIITTMLTNTTGPYQLMENMSRNDKIQTAGKILSCLGFPEESWKSHLWLVCMGMETEQAKKYLSDGKCSSINIYRCPVFITKSVVNGYWKKKPHIASESTRSNSHVPHGKRNIMEVTLFESESKQQKEDVTLSTIQKGIKKVETLAGDVMAARGDSRRGIILEEITELAGKLMEEVHFVQKMQEAEFKDIQEQKNHVSAKLEHSKRLIESYTHELSELQTTLEKVEKDKLALEGRLKEATSSDQSEDSERLKEYANRQKQLEKDLHDKSLMIDNLKSENNDLHTKYGELVEKMEESIQIKQSISAMDVSLTESVKKAERKINKQFGSPIKMQPGVANPAFYESSEDEDSFCTPEHTVHKPKQSLMAMTLTPAKIGLRQWDPATQNFSQWFAGMRMPIEAAVQTTGGDSAVIRLILMCLPPKYSWVTNTVADTASIDTIAKAKAKIIELIYGERGLLEDFFSLKINPGEHPMSFLTRIQTNLEATEEMDSRFLLKAIEEKLIKNIPKSTIVELQRLLANQRTSLTFEKLKQALQQAIVLTGFEPESKADAYGKEILSVVHAMQRNMRCFKCNSSYHLASDCPKKNFKKTNFKHKERSPREPQSEKDGSCFYCKKKGHWKRNCRQFKEDKAKGKAQKRK